MCRLDIGAYWCHMVLSAHVSTARRALSTSAASLPRLAARAEALQRRLVPPVAPPSNLPTSSVIVDDAADDVCELQELVVPQTSKLSRRACTRALKRGGWREAQAVLRLMENEGVRPGPYDLALAAQAFASDGRESLAAQARAALLSAGSELHRADDRALGNLLRGYHISNDATGALTAWEVP